MGIKYDNLPSDTIVDRVARDLLASRGIRTGTRPIIDQKGRVVGSVPTVSFGNPIPETEKVFRDEKGRIIKTARVVKGFLRD